VLEVPEGEVVRAPLEVAEVVPLDVPTGVEPPPGVQPPRTTTAPTNTEATHLISGGEENFGVLLGDVMLKRPGTPEDMAGAAIYLASRAGDYVVGSTLVVDGGVAWAR
jgi:NAD(P)-dependent dehydrogenase (short-subunit alcohol dehydrogenase family)